MRQTILAPRCPPRWMPLAIALLVGGSSLFGPGPLPGARAQEVLTNDSVIGMVKAGLPEAVIVQKIRASQQKFDTSSAALIQLKRAGVPDKVIEAMVGAPAAAPSAGATPTEPTIAHVSTNGEKALKVVRGEVEISLTPFAGTRQEVVLPNARAEYRITDKQPVFSTPLTPDQWVLARLKPGKRDRNLPMSKSSPFAFEGATFREGVDPKYVVAMTAQPGPGGTQLKPTQPLAPGEYGFVAFVGGRPNVVEVFDFGVD